MRMVNDPDDIFLVNLPEVSKYSGKVKISKGYLLLKGAGEELELKVQTSMRCSSFPESVSKQYKFRSWPTVYKYWH